MANFIDFPVLDSHAKCAALWPKYPEKVVGMWATGLPRQNVDVLWRLRQELLKLDVPVIFFFNESAKPLLERIITQESSLQDAQHIYQLDDAKFFRLLNFVKVLVTNDYLVYYPQSRYINAKLVSMPNNADVQNPYVWNYFYDYIICEKNKFNIDNEFNNKNIDGCLIDYDFYPDICKIHTNSHITQLMAAHPKIDILAEERLKCASQLSPPILLLYPNYIHLFMNLQNVGPESYEQTWCDAASAFLSWRPDGLVVFRPTARDRSDLLVQRIKARFADDGRFFVDEDDDNKFWLARAHYFVTDSSAGLINFSMTAKKPVIRIKYSEEEKEPIPDEWGWIISRPEQLIPLWKEMDREERHWTAALQEKQTREMPTLGTNFSRIAGMIKCIFDDNEHPEWPQIDKGHTPCETRGDLLKLVARCMKKSRYELLSVTFWMNDILRATKNQQDPRIWLSFLRRATLPYLDRDSAADIIYLMDMSLSKTLELLPLVQTVGLLRHCLKNDNALAALALLLTTTANRVSGGHKKRVLFLLLMEWTQYDPAVLMQVNTFVKRMPQHFSEPVLDKLNRFLPLAMKVPVPLRRFAACILGLKKPLAKRYWQAQRKLA